MRLVMRVQMVVGMILMLPALAAVALTQGEPPAREDGLEL
jgi:hypothetical protein